MIRIIAFRNFVLRAAMLLLPTVAFAFAGLFRFSIPEMLRLGHEAVHATEYLFLLLLATVIWAITVEQYDVIGLKAGLDSEWDPMKCTRAWAVTYLILLSMTFFVRSMSLSRLFVVLTSGTHLLLSMLLFMGIRRIRQLHLQSASPVSVLIVGSGEFACLSAEKLCASSVMPCQVAGYVRLPGEAAAVRDGKLLEFDDIEKFAIGKQIDEILVALPPDQIHKFSEIVNSLAVLSVPVRAVLDLGNIRYQKILRVGELQILDLHPSPSEQLVYVLLKRLFDVCFAIFVLLAAAPLFALIALLIRLTSPGPILFTQERVGLNGKLFHMYKFRTMRVSSDTESDVRWTVRDDPRRTWIGSILRRTSLDELPQFFNVLMGEMSVVGPRPERPYFVQKFAKQHELYHQRHQLKVGITGWAQVNGWRGDSSISARLDHDLYYLQHWSFAFDLKIVMLTLVRTFFSSNAY